MLVQLDPAFDQQVAAFQLMGMVSGLMAFVHGDELWPFVCQFYGRSSAQESHFHVHVRQVDFGLGQTWSQPLCGGDQDPNFATRHEDARRAFGRDEKSEHHDVLFQRIPLVPDVQVYWLLSFYAAIRAILWRNVSPKVACSFAILHHCLC